MLPAARATGRVLAAIGLAVVFVPPLSAAGARRSALASTRPSAGRPDALLFEEARQTEAALRSSARLQGQKAEWEKVVLRYRKVVGRYPRSGYSDNALLAVGQLYRDMAIRFKDPHYRDDALEAFRRVVAEYPSSSLGDDALWNVLQITRGDGDHRRVTDAAHAYLEACPDGPHAAEVRALLRKRAPSAPLPSPPPPGLARVFDLRAWSGDSSTRVVIDLERKVPLKSDRIADPDRLYVDLAGTRLHPNLQGRSFPVADGLLEKIRLAQNRDDVVRIVLDFKDVRDHSMFYLENPTRLIIDVRGISGPSGAIADKRGETPVDTIPSRRVSGMLDPQPPAPEAPSRSSAPIALDNVARATAPEPPEVNRAGSYSLARQLGLGARRIVIDPGHGGHDPGTIGRGGLQEKDLVLDVAQRLERLVRAELGTEVIMTRSGDAFVPLEERTAIANSKGADLFLSIHANASRDPRARGIETYFLNFAQDPHAEAVAARENAISAATLKDLQGLVKAITLNSKIDESRDFATSVQEAMVRHQRAREPVADRGVHTAPFYVLIGANMPSILAEIAFVSNPEDEKRLRTPEARDLIARSLLRGVRDYLEALSRTQTRQLTGSLPRSRMAAGERGR